MKQKLWLLCVLALLFSVRAYGLGTSFNTEILNGVDSGAINVADTYGDLVAQFIGGVDTFYAIPSAPSSTYVYAVSGCTVYRDTPDSWGQPGDTVTYQFRIVNRGNATDSFVLPYFYVAGDPTWDSFITGVDVYQEYSSRWGYTYSYAILPLAEDAMSTFYFNVLIPTTAAGGDTSEIQLMPLPFGINNPADTDGYTGFNGTQYGGYPESSLTFYILTTCQSYQLTLNKWASIEAPAGYNGAISDPVPGAKITYTIEYDNDGSAIDSLVIYEYIPQFTDLDTATPSMTGLHAGGVTIEFSSDGVNWHSTWVPGSDNRIRWVFDTTVAQNNGDAVGSIDLPLPDVDAGTVAFSVIIQ